MSDAQAPGRAFWDDPLKTDADEMPALPIEPALIDLSKPNHTRQSLADQFFGLYINEGQDAVTARANADARALEMVP